ncbi:MAG: dCMP deaminase, partial [Phycisphaerae bacterium]
PGMITPSAIERCMQAAFNAKLSSGCISRQVGAVVTDREFSIKAVGWNDVPRGAVPCSVRNVKDMEGSSPFGFSLFERGMQSPKGTPSESNPDEAEMESESQRFNEFVKSNYNESVLRQEDLGGINCPYCFKTAYN